MRYYYMHELVLLLLPTPELIAANVLQVSVQALRSAGGEWRFFAMHARIRSRDLNVPGIDLKDHVDRLEETFKSMPASKQVAG